MITILETGTKKHSMAVSCVEVLEVETKRSTCKVSKFGAHVISWTFDGRELLFLSEETKMDGSRPIRGGIPLVFPQFGPGDMVQHGFARRSEWNFISKNVTSDESEAEIVFTLEPTEYTKSMWPHEFLLTYTTKITDEGKMTNTLEVVNKNPEGGESFDFTALLHTYFKLEDISTLKITGLEGKEFIDSLKNDERSPESRREVTIEQNVDRIYTNMQIKHEDLYFTEGENSIKIETNAADIVVWNPWIEKAKGMSDFGDNEYVNMVCIEPGLTGENYFTLPPGGQFSLSQSLSKL